LPERVGIARIGLIDFQDMFFGPSAYDVASLCQDARVTIAAGLERTFRDRYVSLRRAADPGFDREMFGRAYAVSGASRTIKNMGAFARLAASGKQQYLNHLPRLREYLCRSLADPVLSDLALWYERHLTPDSQAAS
jgi:aminoglycoside/choline kinase family phosphotransferase